MRDMLQVITRRWKAASIVIIPVPVQGEGAGDQIAAAIRAVPRIPNVDVIVTGRGGGSLEDLWAFNEEGVARAIFDSPIPVVSAVGHEIDVSIADLVADRRALTPSEAGELVVPDRDQVRTELQHAREQLVTALRQRAVRARLALDALASRRVLTHPQQRIHDLATRLDELDARLKRAVRSRIESVRQSLAGLASSLEALSPLKVLERGYSMTYRLPASAATAGAHELIRRADQVSPGDELVTRFHQGQVTSTVRSVDPDAGAASQVET